MSPDIVTTARELVDLACKGDIPGLVDAIHQVPAEKAGLLVATLAGLAATAIAGLAGPASADQRPAGPAGSGVQRDGTATDRPAVAAIEDTDSPSSPARQDVQSSGPTPRGVPNLTEEEAQGYWDAIRRDEPERVDARLVEYAAQTPHGICDRGASVEWLTDLVGRHPDWQIVQRRAPGPWEPARVDAGGES